jgi:hypothetical protein
MASSRITVRQRIGASLTPGPVSPSPGRAIVTA